MCYNVGGLRKLLQCGWVNPRSMVQRESLLINPSKSLKKEGTKERFEPSGSRGFQGNQAPIWKIKSWERLELKEEQGVAGGLGRRVPSLKRPQKGLTAGPSSLSTG